MHKELYRLSVLIGLLVTADVMASPWELLFSLGASQYQMGSSTYQITTTETDTLRQTNNPWVGTISLGLNYPIPQAFLSNLWLGVNYRHSSHNLFSHFTTGQVAQYQEPELENYTYKLTATNNRILLDLMIPVSVTQSVSLVPLGGIGYGRTSLRYSDVPNEGVFIGNLVLTPRHKSSFIPEVGLGLLYQYSPHIKMTLQYLYTWLGSMDSSRSGFLMGTQTELLAPAHFSLNNSTVLVGLSFSL